MKLAILLTLSLWGQMAFADLFAYKAFEELVIPDSQQDDYFLKFGSETTSQEYGLPTGIIVAKVALQFPETLRNIQAQMLRSDMPAKEIVEKYLIPNKDWTPFFCGALKNVKDAWEMNPEDAYSLCVGETTKLLQRSLSGVQNILVVTVNADNWGDDKFVNLYFRYKDGAEYQYFSFSILHEI
ncbi:MAG: hypothetical protein HOE90_17730 [Bacteriovoracaceae bacterium]|jgi:hypothetical protein|nr:hypothetical protein [Bacteriovoracaceae bacterium]